MNQKPQLTLNDVRRTLQPKQRKSGVSDFLTKEEQEEYKVVKTRSRRRRKQPKFGKVDAYMAEIIARFGYDTYKAWNADEIDDTKMIRMIEAERARERAAWLPIESLLRAVIQGGVPTFKPKKKPPIAKEVTKILKDEFKRARGEA